MRTLQATLVEFRGYHQKWITDAAEDHLAILWLTPQESYPEAKIGDVRTLVYTSIVGGKGWRVLTK